MSDHAAEVVITILFETRNLESTTMVTRNERTSCVCAYYQVIWVSAILIIFLSCVDSEAMERTNHVRILPWKAERKKREKERDTCRVATLHNGPTYHIIT